MRKGNLLTDVQISQCDSVQGVHVAINSTLSSTLFSGDLRREFNRLSHSCSIGLKCGIYPHFPEIRRSDELYMIQRRHPLKETNCTRKQRAHPYTTQQSHKDMEDRDACLDLFCHNGLFLGHWKAGRGSLVLSI
ncbi:hypothetical protein TNCV_3781481 [Trichonephila clavipes]|nr:hypothetical protein TNCV_3781481 [Trichonephila clavipes]